MGRRNVYGGFSSGESMRVLIRELRSDERGVASTVGTIMALLVFLTFLSLIVNQYVPVWMKDSEAAHMNTALGNFGSLKGAIDLQVLAAQAARNAGAFYIPTTASAAIGLGVDGVPIFAAPTIGTLRSTRDSVPGRRPSRPGPADFRRHQDEQLSRHLLRAREPVRQRRNRRDER